MAQDRRKPFQFGTPYEHHITDGGLDAEGCHFVPATVPADARFRRRGDVRIGSLCVTWTSR